MRQQAQWGRRHRSSLASPSVGQTAGHPRMAECSLAIQTWMAIQDCEMGIRHPFAIQVLDVSPSGHPSVWRFVSPSISPSKCLTFHFAIRWRVKCWSTVESSQPVSVRLETGLGYALWQTEGAFSASSLNSPFGDEHKSRRCRPLNCFSLHAGVCRFQRLNHRVCRQE